MMRMMNPNFTFFGNSENWGQMGDLMQKMMRPYTNGLGGYYWQINWIIELTISLLLIALLVSAIRYLWKKGDK